MLKCILRKRRRGLGAVTRQREMEVGPATGGKQPRAQVASAPAQQGGRGSPAQNALWTGIFKHILLKVSALHQNQVPIIAKQTNKRNKQKPPVQESAGASNLDSSSPVFSRSDARPLRWLAVRGSEDIRFPRGTRSDDLHHTTLMAPRATEKSRLL